MPRRGSSPKTRYMTVPPNRTLKSEKQNGGWHHWRVVPRPWRLTRVWGVA